MPTLEAFNRIQWRFNVSNQSIFESENKMAIEKFFFPPNKETAF